MMEDQFSDKRHIYQPYQHSALGLSADGDVIVYAKGGDLQGGQGIMPWQVAEKMKEYGTKDAILLSNGGDINVRLGEKFVTRAVSHNMGTGTSNIRTWSTAAIIVVFNRSGASSPILEIKDKLDRVQAIVIRNGEMTETSDTFTLKLKVITLKKDEEYSPQIPCRQQVLYIENGSADLFLDDSEVPNMNTSLYAGDVVVTFRWYILRAHKNTVVSIIEQTEKLEVKSDEYAPIPVKNFVYGDMFYQVVPVPEIVEDSHYSSKSLALVLRKYVEFEKYTVITNPDFALGVGTKSPKKNEEGRPEIQTPVERPKLKLILVVKGQAREIIYSPQQERVGEVILNEGDKIIVLGGHKIKFLGEQNKIVEVCEGPYPGFEKAKIFFEDKSSSPIIPEDAPKQPERRKSNRGAISSQLHKEDLRNFAIVGNNYAAPALNALDSVYEYGAKALLQRLFAASQIRAPPQALLKENPTFAKALETSGAVIYVDKSKAIWIVISPALLDRSNFDLTPALIRSIIELYLREKGSDINDARAIAADVVSAWEVSGYYGDESGYIENTYAEVKAGDEVTLRAIANRPDFTGTRRVTLYSNIDGTWKFYEEQLEFVRNVKANGSWQAIYEISFKATKDFKYTFAFTGRDDNIVWAKLSYGNGRVHVLQVFTGEVVFIGMEFGPLIKVGGQGDVMFELPRAMVASGSQVSVIVPCFQNALPKLVKYQVEDVPGVSIDIPFTFGIVKVTAKKLFIDGVSVYLLVVDNDWMFVKPYEDDRKEFLESVLLSRASLELLIALGIKPDVIVNNDHHAALVTLYMRTIYADYFAKTANNFIIHNVGYQGQYPIGWYDEVGVSGIEHLIIKSGQLNLMAVVPGVIKHISPKGNYINTVSSTYAREIRKTFFELDMLLVDVGNRFGGILNGIDFDIWNPATDPYIKVNYDINQGIEEVLSAKAADKLELQELLAVDGDVSAIGIDPSKKYGALSVGSSRPLLGVVSRLVGQKQIDIICQMIDDIYSGKKREGGFDLVILGTGEEWLEEELARFVSRNPGASISFVRAYNEKLSRMIYAGADMLLIPSDFEPSGLTQMIAMRYGTIPVVRKTGGLADTVFELGDSWTGFVFNGVGRIFDSAYYDAQHKRENTDQLYSTIRRGVATFHNQAQQEANHILP